MYSTRQWLSEKDQVWAIIPLKVHIASHLDGFLEGMTVVDGAAGVYQYATGGHVLA